MKMMRNHESRSPIVMSISTSTSPSSTLRSAVSHRQSWQPEHKRCQSLGSSHEVGMSDISTSGCQQILSGDGLLGFKDDRHTVDRVDLIVGVSDGVREEDSAHRREISDLGFTLMQTSSSSMPRLVSISLAWLWSGRRCAEETGLISMARTTKEAVTSFMPGSVGSVRVSVIGFPFENFEAASWLKIDLPMNICVAQC